MPGPYRFFTFGGGGAAPAPTTTLDLDIRVDLNADGFFTDPGEDVTGDVLLDAGYGAIRIERGREQLRSLSPPKAGAFDFVLNNSADLYGPTSDLKRGRQTRVRATHNSVTYDLFRGLLDYPVRNPGVLFKTVDVPSIGMFSRLIGKETLSTQLYQNITTDVAIGHVLDAAGWPATERVLDVGITTLNWWWLDQEDAWSAILALLATEGPGAVMYEDGQGRFVFKNRHARYTETRSTTSQVTVGTGGVGIDQAAYEDGLKDVINVVEIEVKSRSAKALAKVWELGETVTLAGGEVRKYIASSGDPFTGAITPVDVIDFVTVSGSATAALDRTSGASVTITLTAGASGAVIADLQLWANPVTVDATTRVANTIDTSTSQNDHGKRPYKHPVRSEISLEDAQNFANAVVSQYQDGRPIVRVRIPGSVDTTAMTNALTREISDRITINEPSIPISAEDYHVENKLIDIAYGGELLEATLGCERIEATQDYAVWGTARWGQERWAY